MIKKMKIRKIAKAAAKLAAEEQDIFTENEYYLEYYDQLIKKDCTALIGWLKFRANEGSYEAAKIMIWIAEVIPWTYIVHKQILQAGRR